MLEFWYSLVIMLPFIRVKIMPMRDITRGMEDRIKTSP